MTRRRKALLATEILTAYARVRWSLWRRDLPGTVVVLRTTRRSGLSNTGPYEGRQLERAVRRVLDPLPRGSRCLTRSLVLVRLLARRRTYGALVIAVQPTEDPALAAHAWVEVDGRPVLTPAPDYGRLVTL